DRAVPGQMEEAVYALGGYLIYTGEHQVELRQTKLSPSEFAILPPSTQTNWLAFQEKMMPYSDQARDPLQMKGWLAGFMGRRVSLSGTHIEGARAIPGGFRFVLELEPGYQVLQDDFLDTQALSPGTYL